MTMTTTTSRPTGPALFPTAAGGVLGVSLDTFTDRHGETRHLIRFEEAGAVIFALAPERAGRLAGELGRLVNRTVPLNREAFTGVLAGISSAWGVEVTLEALAEEAGVDLETATQADSYALSEVLGQTMAGRSGLPERFGITIRPAGVL